MKIIKPPQFLTVKKIKNYFKKASVILMILSMAMGSFPGIMLSAKIAQAAVAGQVGPTAATGFPAWYKDSNGLALDLMEAADTFGISAPVEAGNAFSQQIGFGAEGFWWSAGASIDNGAIQKQATLVLALEAAFAGESAIDGEQSAFGRVRYRIDALTPGETYTIKHPYGTVTEVADVDGVINVTDDIGCFAVAGSKSCDPGSPLGSPLPQFNFAAALSSQVMPFLTWDTFNPVTVSDPDLINLARPDRKYVGNPAIDHAVVGSPINQNIFRVEGPGLPGGFIETDLFSVTGRVAAAAAPVISPIPNQAVQVNSPISFLVGATDANLDPITFSVSSTSALGNEIAATIDPVTGAFFWTPNATGTSVFMINASDGSLNATATVMIEVTEAAPVLSTIAVTPASVSMVAGATRQLTAAALDVGGAQIIPAPALTWTSSDAAVAMVSAAGLVTAVASGTVTIIVTDGNISGSASVAVTPAVQVGGGLTAAIPVELQTGFPKWYKDRSGLALELMEAADTFGISAPVEAGNVFSQQIGFGPEGFWATADASINIPGRKPAVLVQAVEAAFAGESAVNGQQSAFGRIRIRVDVTEPGTYTVTYPYGQKTFAVTSTDIGAGYEINDTSDIGCFAIPGVSSCDPNSPLGSTQAAFNFNGVGLSEVGPFLTWDTYDPLNNDPALTNLSPAYANRKYVGNAAVAHAIKGSPTGNNIFRIEGPNIDGLGNNVIETNLFNVSGRLADITPPVITVTPPNPDSVPQGAPYADPGATALDDFDGDITSKITATGTVDTTATGTYSIVYSVADIAGNAATATRTVEVVAAPATSTVVITSAASAIVIGATQQLSIAVVDANGAAVAPAPTVSLVTADPTIATVDQAGLVTAIAAGTTTITATAPGLADAIIPITVESPLPTPVITELVATSAAPILVTGATQPLSVAALDQNGAIITPAPAVTFGTADPQIATVDPAGTVTAVSPGTTTITATVAGIPDVIVPVTVAEPTPAPVPTEVVIANAAPILVTGATQPLSVAALDQNGAIITPAPAVTFGTADPQIATVDLVGTVTAVAPGTTTITATVAGIPAEITIVTVTDPMPVPVLEAVILVSAAPTIASGTAQQLSVAALDQNNTAIVNPPVVVFETNNPQVATVSQAGIVTAVASGTATIIATCQGKTATTTITVVDPTPVIPSPVVDRIEVVPLAATIEINATTSLDAKVYDQNNQLISPEPLIDWSTSDSAIATIGSHDIVTGHAAGTAIITASIGSVTATTSITVVAPQPPVPILTSINVTPAAATISAGATVQLAATAFDQNNQAMDLPLLSWTSSNQSVATIDASGLVTAVAAGMADITAASGNISGGATITVSAPLPLVPVLTALEIAPVSAGLKIGESQQLAVKAFDQFGIEMSPVPAIIWSSSDAAIAGVDANGRAVAIAAGTVKIAAAHGHVSASSTITVAAPAPVITTTSGSGGGGGGGGMAGGESASVGKVEAINVPLTVDRQQEGSARATLADGTEVEIAVPTGAVSAKTTFKVTQEGADEQNKPLNTAGAYLVGNQVFNITATDQNGAAVRAFGNRLQVSIEVSALIENPAEASVYYFNEAEGQWILVPETKYDPIAKRFVFMVDHLTKFAVFQTKDKPATIPALRKSGEGKEAADDKRISVSAGRVLGEKIFADEALLRLKNGKIFVVLNNKKRQISNLAELRKYAGQKITDVSNDALDNLASVSKSRQAFKDGSLIRDKSKKIFVLKGGFKTRIGSLDELRRNHRGKSIIDVNDDVLLSFPTSSSKKALIAKR